MIYCLVARIWDFEQILKIDNSGGNITLGRPPISPNCCTVKTSYNAYSRPRVLTRKGCLVITWLSLSSSSSSLVSSPKVKRLRALLPSWTEAKRPFVQAAALRPCGGSKTEGQRGGLTRRTFGTIPAYSLDSLGGSPVKSYHVHESTLQFLLPSQLLLPQPHGWGNQHRWLTAQPAPTARVTLLRLDDKLLKTRLVSQ